MFNAVDLWKERFSNYFKETSRYLRYILNGHLLIVFVFLMGTAAFYYNEWIATLSEDFPAAIIMSVVLGLLLTYSPIYSFFKDADTIFLLPLETKLKPYFQRTFILSTFMQGYILLFVLAAFMPMYDKVSGEGYNNFFIFLIILLVLKHWNTLVHWYVLYNHDKSVRNSDFFVRLALNTSCLFMVFSMGWIFVLVINVLMVFLLLYYRKQAEGKGLKWDLLIELEGKRMMRFYRLANMFTDVPKLQEEIKERKYLNGLIKGINFSQTNTYSYLYTRTFIRTGDYFGLLVRLSVIGAIVLYSGDLAIGYLLFSLLFVYLTGLQLIPLWKHHSMKLWVDLYPVSIKQRASSFLKLLFIVLMIENIVFTLSLLIKGEWLYALATLVGVSGFILFFTQIYVKKQITQ